MASLSMALGAASAGGRVFAATAAAKGAGSSREEKGLLDWILGGLQKEGQLLETDPILKKVGEEENGGSSSSSGTTSRSSKSTTSVSVRNKKKSGGFGGFGGLFAKK